MDLQSAGFLGGKLGDLVLPLSPRQRSHPSPRAVAHLNHTQNPPDSWDEPESAGEQRIWGGEANFLSFDVKSACVVAQNTHGYLQERWNSRFFALWADLLITLKFIQHKSNHAR